MTKYTVVWSEEAEEQLATIWINSTNRQSVTKACSEIDNLLQVDASKRGVPIRSNRYSLNVMPLHVLYVVEEMDRMVRVIAVRLISSESNGHAAQVSPSS